MLKKQIVNGWHSTTEMHKMPVFQTLVNELFIMIKDIWKEEWLDRAPVLGNMWVNINYQVVIINHTSTLIVHLVVCIILNL